MEILLRDSSEYDTLSQLERIMVPHESNETIVSKKNDFKSYEEAILDSKNKIIPLEMRCKYKTGRCPLARATKRSGRSLLLCEYHRLKQNSIKRKSDTKYRKDRKAQKELQEKKKYQRKQDEPIRHENITPTSDIRGDEIEMLRYFIL